MPEPKVGEIWKDTKTSKTYRVESVGVYAAMIVATKAKTPYPKRAWLKHFEDGKYVKIGEPPG